MKESDISSRIIRGLSEEEIEEIIQNRQAILGKLMEKLKPFDSFAEQLLREKMLRNDWFHMAIPKFPIVFIRRIVEILVAMDGGKWIGDNYQEGMFRDSNWKYESYWSSRIWTDDGTLRHMLNSWSISNSKMEQSDHTCLSVLIVDRYLEIDVLQCRNSNVFERNAITSSAKTEIVGLLKGLIEDSKECFKVLHAIQDGPSEVSNNLMENFKLHLSEGKLVATSLYTFGPLEGLHDIVMMYNEDTGDPYLAYVIRFSRTCVLYPIYLMKAKCISLIPTGGVGVRGWAFLPQGHEKMSTKELVDLIAGYNPYI